MAKVHNIYCVILITFTVTSSVCGNVFRRESFDIFGALDGFVSGVSNFFAMIKSVTEIFSIMSEHHSNVSENSTVPISEDAFLNVTELIGKYGYEFEEHQVTTEDGYRLNIHRIPKGRNCTSNNITVFLMHGILDSSDSWILQGPENALAYILADEGFDVWMGNARGNKHAMSHVNMTPYDSDFWGFTWEEIGLYDLTATIDYILNVTKNESLYYVGHSQGTTCFYVMSSLRPQYNEKIRMMFSLAPEAYMSHARSPILKLFSPAYNVLGYFLANFNTYSPTSDFFNDVASALCTSFPRLCDNLLYLFIGDNMIDNTLLPVVAKHMPTTASTMQFVHYGQLIQSGRFCRFDFGEEKNLEYYNSVTPPDYDLSNITVPILSFYSGHDWYSAVEDVELLQSKLPKVAAHYIANFSHMDFVYSSAAKDAIYKNIIEEIIRYELTLCKLSSKF